ncbi:hypothetical protein PT974_10583 [Cladobotryum mycophilum]|uniref:F-box domain-containing protein n=1 Tax=Cladobotryum mycophilum TaxID=491253 RepID=A0ABR0SB92_9HYPO
MGSLQAVISTEELLEAILIHTDMRTLLTSCQGVCKFWNSVIKTSPSIQRELFFLPESPSKGPRRMNSLLTQHFPQWFQDPEDSQDHIMYRRKNGYSHFTKLSLYTSGIKNDDNPYLREEASWRKMLTAQPPITVLGIFDYGFHYMQFESRSRVREYPTPERPLPGTTTGMRMGEFYDLVLRHCATWEVSGFTIMQRVDEISKESFLHTAARPTNLEEDLGKLRDEGMQVLLQLFCSSGCFIGLVPKEKYPFWNKCGMSRAIQEE